MRLTGLRKEKETEEIIEYELKLYRHEVSCLYQDRYGVYVATYGGKLYKVKHTLEELELELN
jgi:nitrogenase molybdenum-iron protein alpha/beta subunit